MSLAKDLLAQANYLAVLDKGRPKQANLRRAVSSAYYAVFHLLVAEACRAVVPGKSPVLFARVGRAFQHGEMKQVCNAFRKRPLPELLGTLLRQPVSDDLRGIAESFVELQEARHSADYDLSLVLTRANVHTRLGDAEAVFRAWDRVRSTDEANVLLAALAFGARWAR